MEWLDSYVIKARLFPAILAAAPAIVFALANVAASFDSLGLPQIILTVAVGVLFFAFSDLARRFGRHAERKMFSTSGGRPFPTVLRHSDETIDRRSKERYHKFLATKLGESAPTSASEKNNPQDADGFYILAGNWLRERTRDQSTFYVLFAENVSYGFRRNLFGLKWVGLTLNLIVIFASVYLIWASSGATLPQYGGVLIIAAVHALYFLLWVTEASVIDASNQYGRQLVVSSESLMD